MLDGVSNFLFKCEVGLYCFLFKKNEMSEYVEK